MHVRIRNAPRFFILCCPGPQPHEPKSALKLVYTLSEGSQTSVQSEITSSINGKSTGQGSITESMPSGMPCSDKSQVSALSHCPNKRGESSATKKGMWDEARIIQFGAGPLKPCHRRWL